MSSTLPPRVGASACLSAALLAIAAVPLQANAWGADGHRLIAAVAEDLLTPQAKAEALRLLALEPGATLVTVSTWADETRSPQTAAWHYVNIPESAQCSYDAAVLCANGNCVVGAIDRQLAILGSSAPDVQRLQALKYVVHFIGDVHQPLHAGLAEDKGGNTYQLQAYGRGTNLHAVWDSALIRGWPEGIVALQAVVAADARQAPGSSGEWAEQSCRVVSSEDFYPRTHRLEGDYPQRWSVTLRQQLAAASQRLATSLNTVLGSH